MELGRDQPRELARMELFVSSRVAGRVYDIYLVDEALFGDHGIDVRVCKSD